MEEHENLCPTCQKKALQIRRLTKRLPLLARAKTTPSFDLMLHARLRKELNQRRPFAWFPNPGRLWQIPAYAAAAILFVGLGIFLDRFFVQQNGASSSFVKPLVVEEILPNKPPQSNSTQSTQPETRMSHYVGLKQINPKDLLRREGIALSSEGMRRLSSMQKDTVENNLYRSRGPSLNIKQANASIGF